MNKLDLPTLYGLTAEGAVKVWDVKVTQDSYISSYGQVGGQLTVNERKVTPKNVGRANETTPSQQAVKEATSAYQKKLNEGYCTDASRVGEDAVTRRMRCYVYDISHIQNSLLYFVQPKLNGVKCFVKKVDESTMSYQSSGGKQYATMHKFDTLLLDKMAIGEELDTEVYFHGAALQEISSAVKKENELTKYLQLWAYDVVGSGGFKDRYNEIVDIIKRIDSDMVVNTPTFRARGLKELDDRHDVFIKAGYEGSIIRTPYGTYVQGRKSLHVLKRKNWSSDEFEIVDIDEDVRGCIIYVCKLGNGYTFRAVPEGTQESRRRLYDKGAKAYVGKMLTVKYSDVSDAGCPQGNPIAENIRMKEDMDTTPKKKAKVTTILKGFKWE